MKRLIGKLLCWLGAHRRPAGWNPHWAWYAECERRGCRALLTGRLGGAR